MSAALRREHLLSEGPFSSVKGRAVDIYDQLRACRPLHDCRTRRIPDVFTDIDANRCPIDLVHRALAAGSEIAVLVEDSVVWEVHLAVDADNLAVIDDCCRIVNVGVGVNEPDDGGNPLTFRRDPEQLITVLSDELRLEQQVLRRIAGQGEFGESYKVGAQVASISDCGNDALGVAVEVSDGGVHLSHCDAEEYAWCELTSIDSMDRIGLEGLDEAVYTA